MSSHANSKVRHRTFDRLRQKLWAVPAWLWLCVFRREVAKPARRRNQPIR